MGSKKSRNPFGFTALPVTVITLAVYIALASGILYVHLIVPGAPESPTPYKGVNITEAWRDLQTLTEKFHPYNSRESDTVHKWLLSRIDEILTENGAEHVLETKVGAGGAKRQMAAAKPPFVTVFDDRISNLTVASATLYGSLAVYFEATNVMVYIRGSSDKSPDWWRQGDADASSDESSRGLLVNAHYDSVSTGYGATDNGVGVVTTLQLVKYFSTPGNQPKRGFVALFNNGEEDFLNGARAFMKHPLSRFPDVFLNLEGAGAGGRALLLRSTDAEVTDAYRKSSQPFGTIMTADAFNRGVVKSQTDYVVFNNDLKLRGLDVAFYQPRARYHTNQDSTTWTSKASLWDMLNMAVTTSTQLTSNNVNFSTSHGSKAIWFDIMGQVLALLKLHTLFAISVSLLVVAPIVMIGIAAILGQVDRYYLFARKARSDPLDPRSPDEETVIQFNGWRGVFRYPITFVFATAAVAGLVLLVAKFNPYIVYSSPYAVWSMMLSVWFFVTWFFLRGSDFIRPTALHRAHAFGWLFVVSWLLLVTATIGENNFGVATGYFLVVYFAAIFLALLLSYLEMFGLPRKSEYVQLASRSATHSRPISVHRGAASIRSGQVYSPQEGPESSATARDSADVTVTNETTSLLSRKRNRPTRYRDDEDSENEDDEPLPRGRTYGDEQPWSATLPSWLWVLQFLVIGPIPIILIGELGLFGIIAVYQTPADGNSVYTIYGFIGIISVLLLIPISPFLHRFSSRVPFFLFLVFLGTLIYNLLAFPFSPENRLKVYFQQELDLASGINTVSLTGLDGYIQTAVDSLPSATGQRVNCTVSTLRSGLTKCAWTGLAPHVVGALPSHNSTRRSPSTITAVSPTTPSWQSEYRTWVSVNATRLNTTENSAVFTISGQHTRACKLVFDAAVADYSVEGAAPHDDRFAKVPKEGTKEIRLWHREWDRPWIVKVRWEAEGGTGRNGRGERGSVERVGLEGKAVCLWSDANEAGVIPALDEATKYLPAWVTATKASDGLVEGFKRFRL